jgi:hypothetical protein
MRAVDWHVQSDTARDLQLRMSQLCMTNQTQSIECSSAGITPAQLPNRIIEIDLARPNMLRLIDTREEDLLIDRYVALSHRWGVGEDVHYTTRTTDENYEQFRHGIIASDLCNKYQDAIAITTNLGVRYIWIDSICIIQGNFDDWSSESREMFNIYHNAFLTIAASEANNSHDSCSGPDPVITMPCRFTQVTKHRNEDHLSHLFLHPAQRNLFTSMVQSPLYNRAWLLQEWVLSTRILMYCSNQVIWECNATAARIADGVSPAPNLYAISDAKRPIQMSFAALNDVNSQVPHVRPTADELYEAWYLLIAEYSTRDMSFPRDKLPAIRGLVTGVKQCLSISDPSLALRHDSYHAGLWEGDFARGLLWCRDDRSAPAPQPLRAPSWSWAAHDCSIDWPRKELLFNQAFEQRAVWTDFDTPAFDDVTGNTAGWVVVDGVVKMAGFQGNVSPTLFADGRTWDPLHCMMDDEVDFDMDRIWVLKVAATVPLPAVPSIAICLVLVQVPDGAGLEYRRVGYMEVELDWFDGLVPQRITIR